MLLRCCEIETDRRGRVIAFETRDGEGCASCIDAIPQGTNGCGTIFTVDQRGTGRPLGNSCDIGAFERANAAPIATDDASYSTDEDATLTVIAPGVLENDTDANGDRLTAALVSAPAHAASFTLNPDGSFTYTPKADYNGSDSFTYKASDGALDSDVATVTITVGSANDAPTLTIAGGQCQSTTFASGRLNLTVADVESPPNTLTLTATSSNQALIPGVALVLSGTEENRTLAVTPWYRQSGIATVTLSLSDGTDTTTLPVTVKVGTPNTETLTGTSGADMIFGLDAQDTLSGLGGSDLLCAGTANDTLSGGAGNDVLGGGGGKDVLKGGAGADRLRGEGGADKLTGGADADFFSGGAGTDSVTDFDASEGDTKDRTIP